MNTRVTLLAAACTLALAACGGDRPAPAEDIAPPPAVQPDDTAPPADTAPVEETAAEAGDTAEVPAADAPEADTGSEAGAETGTEEAAAGDDGAATVSGCATTIGSNDRMQFDVSSISIPASCSDFTIHLNHTGRLPVAAMGHNVVITTTADYVSVAAAGLSAGAAAGYVPADDARVIAHTDMIGGGQSTSVTFSTGKLTGGESYDFFCSFPGHAALMRGKITLEQAP